MDRTSCKLLNVHNAQLPAPLSMTPIVIAHAAIPLIPRAVLSDASSRERALNAARSSPSVPAHNALTNTSTGEVAKGATQQPLTATHQVPVCGPSGLVCERGTKMPFCTLCGRPHTTLPNI